MIITFVIDSFTNKTDGTVITANRFAEQLRKRGHEVRICAINVSGNGMYVLKERYIPLATYFSHKHGQSFAKPDRAVLASAMEGADVVHFFMPWKAAIVGKKIADKMGIATTAAFHVHPQNMTYTIGKRLGKPLAELIFWLFRQRFYRHFDYIHCPSEFTAKELKKHKYKSNTVVISNGVSDVFKPTTMSKLDDGFFNVLMIGRLAREKRQDVIVKAVMQSKYKDKIKLYFAGKGPERKRLEKLGSKLVNPPEFKFLPQSELIDLIHNSDLYVHAADVEIEGIACLEALSCGKCMLFANSRLSATPQFAIDERSLFRAGDPRDLAQKIDFFIEHPEARRELEKRYAEKGKHFAIENSITLAEQFFEKAITTSRQTS
ncbi:MAG: glycosyltransferase [Christensenellaceae bacterium]|jgi:glycosyltransferase involved in cell wall biosynthesis|nr:glycosyltransferase [Christensenellaceae bacterium]